MKKGIALLLATALVFGAGIPALGAEESVDYTVTNPYETVDWDTWNHYKAQLHTHTLYSDGEMNITDVVEAYYAQDYDILAITDHGVINTGWNKQHRMIPLIGFNQYTKVAKEIRPMSDARYMQITTGEDRDGRPMLDVSKGVELNALVVRKNHVNGFFCGWGQGYLGKEEDFEIPVAKTEAAGGISFINHPADFFNASADVNRAKDRNNVKLIADTLLAHPSCVGMEAFNCEDTVDRYGRVFWDSLLEYCIPRGRNVWAFASDDSHWMSHIGLTAEIMLMPELSEASLRTAMENGTFFSCSTIANVEFGDGDRRSGNFADVQRISVDEENDSITVTAANADVIEWVADGEVIATGESICLRDHADRIGAYVRFQIKNEGGILLSQAFVCDDGDMESNLIPEPVDTRTPIEQLFAKILAFFRKTIIGELLYRKFVLEKKN
ncbi:MAG: hypothetical protein IJT27_04220 [Clostridia bacterium]|nr:hypothetical protein [Clostridia bacterium]